MLSVDAIVIGASSGGVDAVGMLLAALPSRFRTPVVIVLHLLATAESLLVPVLAARCARPVREAADKEPIEAGVVYVAPPGYHLLVEPDLTFALSIDAPVNFCRPSIDVMFESAAYAWRERLLGIVLTGANADGAEGLAAIRRFGGRAWVQDPESAVAPAMPAAAIARAGADRVLSLEAMAAALAGVEQEPTGVGAT